MHRQSASFPRPSATARPTPAERHCPFRSYANRWATVSAHYDGPVAQTCRYASHPPGGGFSRSDAVAECRAKLIVLSVGPDTLPATDALAAAGMDQPPASSPPLLPWLAVFGLASLIGGWASRTRKWR